MCISNVTKCQKNLSDVHLQMCIWSDNKLFKGLRTSNILFISYYQHPKFHLWSCILHIASLSCHNVIIIHINILLFYGICSMKCKLLSHLWRRLSVLQLNAYLTCLLDLWTVTELTTVSPNVAPQSHELSSITVCLINRLVQDVIWDIFSSPETTSRHCWSVIFYRPAVLVDDEAQRYKWNEK